MRVLYRLTPAAACLLHLNELFYTSRFWDFFPLYVTIILDVCLGHGPFKGGKGGEKITLYTATSLLNRFIQNLEMLTPTF